jgi:hypothetical protein
MAIYSLHISSKKVLSLFTIFRILPNSRGLLGHGSFWDTVYIRVHVHIVRPTEGVGGGGEKIKFSIYNKYRKYKKIHLLQTWIPVMLQLAHRDVHTVCQIN